MCLQSDSLHKVMERLANPGKLLAHQVNNFAMFCLC